MQGMQRTFFGIFNIQGHQGAVAVAALPPPSRFPCRREEDPFDFRQSQSIHSNTTPQ